MSKIIIIIIKYKKVKYIIVRNATHVDIYDAMSGVKYENKTEILSRREQAGHTNLKFSPRHIDFSLHFSILEINQGICS